jgi:hypothetical protein
MNHRGSVAFTAFLGDALLVDNDFATPIFMLDDRLWADSSFAQLGQDNWQRLRLETGAVNGRPVQQVLRGGGLHISTDAVEVKIHEWQSLAAYPERKGKKTYYDTRNRLVISLDKS